MKFFGEFLCNAIAKIHEYLKKKKKGKEKKEQIISMMGNVISLLVFSKLLSLSYVESSNFKFYILFTVMYIIKMYFLFCKIVETVFLIFAT